MDASDSGWKREDGFNLYTIARSWTPLLAVKGSET